MGTMTFLLPADLSALAARELERACIAGGPDNMPWPTKVQVEPGRLVLYRDVEESGYLVVPWEIENAGRLVGTTATLMERALPYHLQVELARGKVNQLRGQAFDWQTGGLPVSAELDGEIRAAGRAFGHAITETQPDLTCRHAQRALVQAYQAAEHLTQRYMDQVFLVRHQREPRLSTALGCRLEQAPPQEAAAALVPACSSVALPFRWVGIEGTEGSYDWQAQDAAVDWAEAQGLNITAGPLIDFSGAQLPAWLWLYDRDLQSLAKFMANYVAAALRRYRRRIRRWQLTSASNSAALLSLGEEELLWLTVRLAQAARQVDPTLDLIVGIAQPWGEYMSTEDRSHSPFIFADTLIRSELEMAALDIELVMGVTPRGSRCRDLLEASRLLDLYALLGVPLQITLAYPASSAPDPDADAELRVDACHWHGPYSPRNQADWAQAFVSLAVCKPYVQGVHWAQCSDAGLHQFPHCGLFDCSGRPRPSLEVLRTLRERHLQ
jgi:hypothetical protein